MSLKRSSMSCHKWCVCALYFTIVNVIKMSRPNAMLCVFKVLALCNYENRIHVRQTIVHFAMGMTCFISFCHGYYMFYFLNKANMCTVQLSSTLCIPNLFYCNVIYLHHNSCSYPTHWPEALPLLLVLLHCHLVATLANWAKVGVHSLI